MFQDLHKISISLFLMLLLSVAGIGYYLASYTGFLPKTFVAALNVGAMTPEQAKDLLKDKIALYQDDIAVIQVNGETFFFHIKDLGISFDVEETIDTLFAEQEDKRPDSMLTSAMLSYADEYEKVYAKALEINVDEDKLRETVSAVVPQVENPEDAGVIFFEGGDLGVRPSKIGYTLNYTALASDLKQHAAVLRVPRHLSYGLLEDAPNVDTIAAEAIFAKLNAVKDNVIHLKVERPGEDPATWDLPLNTEEFWSITEKDGELSVELDRDKIRQFLEVEVAPVVSKKAENITITGLPEGAKKYPQVEGTLQDGIFLPASENVHRIVDAVEGGTYDIDLVVRHDPAVIINKSGSDLGNLELLATGRSNFTGSPTGRDFNIRRGLDEKMNNILLAPGETFSYNSYLGPVTYSAGWAGSLAIFGGKDLRKVPGGGLCQVSTTIYRALLNAGLSVEERSPHSLYVHYYVPHGEGLDAAIFPGVKDLVFTNDTDNYIYLQSYHQGDDAFVKIYGTDDGRRVDLQGPYRHNEVPEDLATRKYSSREIIWFQKITWPGTDEVEVREITSRYRTLPRK